MRNKPKSLNISPFFLSLHSFPISLFCPTKQLRVSRQWELWSVHHTLSLLLLAPHTPHLLRCGVPSTGYSPSQTSPTQILLTGCSSSWTAPTRSFHKVYSFRTTYPDRRPDTGFSLQGYRSLFKCGLSTRSQLPLKHIHLLQLGGVLYRLQADVYSAMEVHGRRGISISSLSFFTDLVSEELFSSYILTEPPWPIDPLHTKTLQCKPSTFAQRF